MSKISAMLHKLWKENSELETEEEFKKRWKSIFVIYVTIFLMTLGFGITLTGVWPYLDKLDPSAGKTFYGIILAVSPLSQMIASPLVGYWTNKTKSSRIPLICTMILFAFASIMYATLDAFDTNHKYWMLIARILIGTSSANIAVCRAYLSAATTVKERTTAVSLGSLAQVLGFIFGPAFQAALTPLGNEGTTVGKIVLNMYTAPGWVNVLLAIINIVILLPWAFEERPIAAKEAMVVQGKDNEEAAVDAIKLDYVAAWTLIVAFFVLVLNFVLLETLGTPLMMDQFALTKQESLKYISIIMAIGAVISCISFVTIGPLCKHFDERKIMIWGGFFLMVVGRFVFIPWGSSPPTLREISSNETEIELVGCPVETQTWCATTNALTVEQFIIGYVCTAIGYPIGATLIQTILSKILGPRPQGVWMGLFTGSGGFSRVVGPVLLSALYQHYGVVWTFCSLGAFMAVTVVWLLCLKHRLVPAVYNVKDENGKA
ncbi:major facilitator superfamily domain-containing protein 8-like [Culicoides brevitarsis]|uniref:major facilitator superfamily domain-containing protein 8-like n=1 Tax=Culicoides brevitarsis TaxID=469753 RepID=UPI00307C52AE